jgi:hypothetical protein
MDPRTVINMYVCMYVITDQGMKYWLVFHLSYFMYLLMSVFLILGYEYCEVTCVHSF